MTSELFEIGITDGTPVLFRTVLTIYFQEFFREYAPSLLKLFSIITLLFNFNISSNNNKIVDQNDSNLNQKELIAIKEQTKKFSHFSDDRKASKGTENDVYMLKTHGYNKFRFVSKDFLKRNKLKSEIENIF